MPASRLLMTILVVAMVWLGLDYLLMSPSVIDSFVEWLKQPLSKTTNIELIIIMAGVLLFFN